MLYFNPWPWEGDSRCYSIDTDECINEDDNCTQLCYNTEGSYSCSCQDGYFLQDYYDCLGKLS